MCTVVILRRPGHDWPLVLAGNRDEMADRPWKPVARHWPDRPWLKGGLDELAGGTWLALNDDGVVACILNRQASLGPAPGKRSRGELPLDACDHADAADAAEAFAHLSPEAYRPFNMVVADNRDAFWVRNDGQSLRVEPIPDGVSLLASRELNDASGPRLRRALPLFREAAPPDPDTGDAAAWEALLGDTTPADPAIPASALCFQLDGGFGTRSSSIIAVPGPGLMAERAPFFRFAAGPPDRTAYQDVGAF